ncbi:MAG: hypothetical protein ABIX10_07315 [Acidimicrobiales bacterium]
MPTNRPLIEPGERYGRNPAVLWRSTSRGPVLFAPDALDPVRLEGLAALVWEVLDRSLLPVELISAIAALSPTSDVAGVESAVEELTERDLVEALA